MLARTCARSTPTTRWALSPSRAVEKNAGRTVEVRRREGGGRSGRDLLEQRRPPDVVVGELLVLRIARDQDFVVVDDRGGDVAAAENVGEQALDPGQVQRGDDDEIGRMIRRPLRERCGEDRAMEHAAHQQPAQREPSAGDGLLEKGAVADVHAHHVRLARAQNATGGRSDRQRFDHVAAAVEVAQQASAALRIDVALRLGECGSAHHRARQRQHLAVHLGAVLRQIARRRLGHADSIGAADLEAADALDHDRGHRDDDENEYARPNGQGGSEERHRCSIWRARSAAGGI